MPYNSVTEHPWPIKLLMIGTLIFGLVSKSVDRISKFALINKLGKNFKFLWSAILDSAILDSTILGSPVVTIQAEVTMVTVPVAMVTDWLPWKYRGFCIKVPSFDHVTRDPRDRPWWLALVAQKPYISILLGFVKFFEKYAQKSIFSNFLNTFFVIFGEIFSKISCK